MIITEEDSEETALGKEEAFGEGVIMMAIATVTATAIAMAVVTAAMATVIEVVMAAITTVTAVVMTTMAVVTAVGIMVDGGCLFGVGRKVTDPTMGLRTMTVVQRHRSSLLQ